MHLHTSLLLAIVAVFGLVNTAEGDTLVNRRVLESEPGWANVVKHLEHYEVHDFSSHEPTRRVLQSVGEQTMTYELNVLGRRTLLELERFDELFAKGYKHSVIGENGEVLRTEPAPTCIYKGRSTADKDLLATVSLCDGFVHATIQGNGPEDSFTIQPLTEKAGSEHVVYRHRDLKSYERFCGVGRDLTMGINTGNQIPVITYEDRHLRAQPEQHHSHDIRETKVTMRKGREDRRLDATTKIVGIAVVNDKRRFEQKGNGVHTHSSQLMAVANNLYKKLGVVITSTYQIRLEIVSMHTFTIKDPWSHVSSPANSTNVPIDGNGEVDANNVLTAFNNWRATGGVVNSGTNGGDVAHLLTGFTFQSSTIGLAFNPGACTSSRAGTTQAYDLSDAQISSTITHEIGHNLGVSHTDTPPSGFSSCLNANGEHIMATSSAIANTNWEACSVEYLKRFFEGNPYQGNKCSENTANANGDPAWDGTPVCGDGLIQVGEECDCLGNNCLNVDPCCNGLTCQLLPGKQCSALGGCCDPNTCTIIADTNHVCRAAVTNCDIEETCPGDSGVCPFDNFHNTGVPCILGDFGVNGTCYNKACMDQKKDCTEEGATRTNPSEHWDQTCRNEDTGIGTVSGDCVLNCKKGLGSCVSLQGPVYFSDGTQCQTGKGCYQGSCILFEDIPVPNNPNCTNGVVDQNETDLDCGGPSCFGCGAGQLCAGDGDCIFGNCNKTSLTDANGYTGLGRCSAAGLPPNQLEEVLNSILKWFRENPQIWGPIVGVLGLLILFCCCCPRGSKPPVAKAGMMQAQQSFRQMRGQGEIPTAMVVKG